MNSSLVGSRGDLHDRTGIATILVSAPNIPSAIYGAMREVLAKGYRIRTQYDRKDAQGNHIDPPSLHVSSAIEILDPYAQPRFPKSSCVEIGEYIAETCWGVKDMFPGSSSNSGQCPVGKPIVSPARSKG